MLNLDILVYRHFRKWFPVSISCLVYIVNKRATSSFALVHSDVWGLSRVMNPIGVKYFVTFIDDFSCCMWVWLMKNKSELFSIFEIFYNEIKLSLVYLFVVFVVIMLENTSLINFSRLWHPKASFVKHLVPTLNKMGFLSAKIGTLLKQLKLFSMAMFPSVFGVMLCSQPATSLVACHLLSLLCPIS